MTTSAKSSVSKQSNQLDMNQDVAQSLFHEGATLIFTDVPKGTEFGIDCNVWTVDHKFKGIKMIPPGIHFVYYRYQDIAPFHWVVQCLCCLVFL